MMKKGGEATDMSSNSGSRRSSGNERKQQKELEIREIRKEEAQGAADLVARLKRLNGEFDPLLKTSPSLEVDSLKAIRQAMESKESVVLVAVQGGSKVVGVVKADLIDRVFYEPRREGKIDEFYILPEFRRGNLGNDLLNAIVSALKKKGAALITAEFPSQNEIARKFYTKLGFRSITNVFAKTY